MNEKYDKIITRLNQHLVAALNQYDKEWFVICLQGSQNYNLDDENSDIDSKLLILPSLEDIVLNKQAISKTFIMENDEHCDVKDVREYFRIFRKQNINFVEILFTDYYIVNPKYAEDWLILREHREEIARYDVDQALKCMKGMCAEKLHALTHEYPSRMKWIETFGYDPKQLSHMIRIKNFVDNYIAGEPYSKCLIDNDRDYLIKMKRGFPTWTVEDASLVANDCWEYVKNTVDEECAKTLDVSSKDKTDAILNQVLLSIVTKHLKDELK